MFRVVLALFVVALGIELGAGLVELGVTASTLLYFRPTLVHLFMSHGAGLSPEAIMASVRRWVHWSYGRVAVSFVAWCVAIVALVLPF